MLCGSRAAFGAWRLLLENAITSTYRFLLDQNFPKPVFDIGSLDAHVEYVHLHDFDPRLARVTTPDWMIYLIAEQAAFTGVVTRDRSQLDQDEELVVLSRNRVSIVTWRRSIEDAVTEWGQLLAYMPLVTRLIEQEGPRIILLPEPRLGSQNADRPDASARMRAARLRTSYPEFTARALNVMDRYLSRRKREDLQSLLRN
jgi:hypothetical protein